MANNIDPALKRAVILKAAMAAFKHRLVSLGLFSTVFKDIPLEGSNDIEVPYYPLVTAASKDYNGTYEFDEGDLESKKITVNKRKYQSLTYTSEEKARQPYFDPEQLGRLKGAKLAEDVLCDILSCVTAENFGAAAVSANADEFDADNVIDLETACDESDWPDAMRGLIIKSGYLGNLKKEHRLLRRRRKLRVFAHRKKSSGPIRFQAFEVQPNSELGRKAIGICGVSERDTRGAFARNSSG